MSEGNNVAAPFSIPPAPLDEPPPGVEIGHDMLADAHPLGSDADNADRLARALDGRALYDPDTSTWYAFNGASWIVDPSALRVEKIAVEVLSQVKTSLRETGASPRAAAALLSQRSVRSAIDACRREPNLWANATCWDTDPDLLACPNGTLNLRTGEFGRAKPEHRCRRVAGVEHVPGAQAHRWVRFIDEVTGGDRELATYLKRFAGYALLGRESESAVHISYGSGANGKSIFFDAMAKAMGTYACTLGGGALLAVRDNGGDKPRADLVQLPGARLAVANELPRDARLDERLLKSLASGGTDSITVRGMYQRTPITFRSAASVAIVTNHRPMIESSDAGIWRRLRVVPWDQAFVAADDVRSPNQRAADPNVETDIGMEIHGVLQWIIEGAKDYLDSGLPLCDAVRDATAAYRDECDIVGSFVRWACDLSPEYETPTSQLYTAFVAWARSQDYLGVPRMQDFVSRMEGQSGVARAISRPGEGPARQRPQARVLRGVRLAGYRDNEEAPIETKGETW